MKTLSIPLMGLLLFSGSCQSTGSPVEQEAVAAALQYVQAGDNQDLQLFDIMTHDTFRVVAVDFPNPGEVSVVPRNVFRTLLAEKKVGGLKREAEITSAHRISSNSVSVCVAMKSVEYLFSNCLSLVRVDGSWRIAQDFATVKPATSADLE